MCRISEKEAERLGYVKNRHYIAGTSFSEQLLYRCLIQIFANTVNRVKDAEIGLEFDIYIPELELRIEYSGEYWHEKGDTPKRDEMCREYCRENDYAYMEIIEHNRDNKLVIESDGNYTLCKLGVQGKCIDKVTNILGVIKWILKHYCQTAHCGRCKLHFDFGVIASPIVPYRNLPQALSGITADCRSLV